jgi:hypothetical protein
VTPFVRTLAVIVAACVLIKLAATLVTPALPVLVVILVAAGVVSVVTRRSRL